MEIRAKNTLTATTNVNDILRGETGPQGPKGEPGYTPVKGVDYFDGETGPQGERGESGKSAYEFAKDAGYTGTEEEFAEKLAGDSGVTSWNDLTDKPFIPASYKDLTDTPCGEIFDFSTMVFNQMGGFKFTEIATGSYYTMFDAKDSNFKLTVGKTYRVKVSYMGMSVYVEFDGIAETDMTNAIYIVSGSERLTLTGKIITISCKSIHPNITSSSMIAIQIYEGNNVAIPLNEKYIPDTIARVDDIPSIPQIPTKTSELTNDSGFITAEDIPEPPAVATPDWSVNDQTNPGYIENRTHYTIKPGYEITWDGDTTDKFVMDLTDLGYENTWLVKVSDVVSAHEELIGSVIGVSNGETFSGVTEDDIASMFPGTENLLNGVVSIISSASETNAALGLPDGTLTNGVYFMKNDSVYTNKFIIQDDVKTIDAKYLPDYVKNNVPRKLPPKFNIAWDGDMTDKFAIDGSQIGFENVYFVKVSDTVYNYNDFVDARLEIVGLGDNDGQIAEIYLTDDDLDIVSFPGAIKLSELGVVINDSDTLNATLGLPEGTITNGIYFALFVGEVYTHELTAREEIIKLSADLISDDIPRYDDVYNIVNNAIAGAIGGSY